MTDRSTATSTELRHRVDGAALGELYPKAKTYDQQLADQADRSLRRLARRPRFIVLQVTLRLFMLAVAAALIVAFAPVIIFMNIFAGVFGVAFLMIVLLGACKWQADEVSAVLYGAGFHASGFLVMHFTAIGPLVALALFAVTTQLTGVWLIAGYVLVFAVQLAIVGAIVRRMVSSILRFE